jgi:hypothetical protein
VETKWTQSSVLAFVCPELAESRIDAHPAQVGLSGVRDSESRGMKLSGLQQEQATGGVLIAQPRTTDLTINVQQTLGAYGTPSHGTSVFTAKGSLMARPIAPATGKASGVPPRGRPV